MVEIEYAVVVVVAVEFVDAVVVDDVVEFVVEVAFEGVGVVEVVVAFVGVVGGGMKDEQKILGLIAERLEMGATMYGPLDVRDGRQWVQEALEEMLDGIVYIAARLVQMKEEDEMSSIMAEKQRETVRVLEGVLRACEKARAEEEGRLHNCRPRGDVHLDVERSYQSDVDRKLITLDKCEESTRITNKIIDLDALIRRRAELVDGTEQRCHDEDTEYYVTTRRLNKVN